MATVAPPRMSQMPAHIRKSSPLIMLSPEKPQPLRQIGYTTGSLSMGEKVIIRKPEGTTSSTLNNLGGGEYSVSFSQRKSDGSNRAFAECRFSNPEGCEKDISRRLDMPSRDLVFMFCYDDDSPTEEVEDDDSEDDTAREPSEAPKRRGCCSFR